MANVSTFPTSAFIILLVDQQDYQQDDLYTSLLLEGFSVERVADGFLASVRAEGLVPHLIVISRTYLEWDTLAFIRWIRKHPVLGTTYVYILSDRMEEEDEVMAFDSGADEYLLEPVHVNALLARIRSIYRSISRQRVSLPQSQSQVLSSHIEPENEKVNIENQLCESQSKVDAGSSE